MTSRCCIISFLCFATNSTLPQIRQEVNKQGETQLKFPDGFFPSNCCNDESSEMIIHLQSIYKQQGRSDVSCDYICGYIKAVYDLSVIVTNWGLYLLYPRITYRLKKFPKLRVSQFKTVQQNLVLASLISLKLNNNIKTSCMLRLNTDLFCVFRNAP